MFPFAPPWRVPSIVIRRLLAAAVLLAAAGQASAAGVAVPLNAIAVEAVAECVVAPADTPTLRLP